jgi:hypothetical protein
MQYKDDNLLQQSADGELYAELYQRYASVLMEQAKFRSIQRQTAVVESAASGRKHLPPFGKRRQVRVHLCF